MPYNSAATPTTSSDSMVGPCPASRPHRKSTSSGSGSTGIEHARKLAVRSSGACTCSLIDRDTWPLSIALGRFKLESQRVCLRRPESQP